MSFFGNVVQKALQTVVPKPEPRPPPRPERADGPPPGHDERSDFQAQPVAAREDSQDPGHTPRPGDPDFVGPVQPPQPGDPAFVGPVRPPVTGDNFNPDDPGSVDALARQYAPIRYLHPDEQYGPGDPNHFIENSRLQDHNPVIPDSTRFEEGEGDASQLPHDDKDDLYLDLDDTAEARGGQANAPSFYEYDKASNTLTYHHFYNYNDAPGPGNLDHEGDWERVTIQFDDKMKPTEVRYSAHEGSTSLPWDQAPKEDGRPVTYVGQGSHANSPTPGEEDVMSITAPVPTAPGAPQPQIPIATDHFARGERVDDQQRPLLNVTEQPWYGTNAHWGERGNLAALSGISDDLNFTSGPEGPSEDKGHL